MSAATWPAPSLSGTTRQVPEGISAVVHAPPVCVGAVDGAEDAVLGAALDAVVPPPAEDGAADPDVEAEPAPGLPSGADEDVLLPTEFVLPTVDPPVAEPLAEVLPEHPAVSAAAPNAPAATKTEIRFMEPNLSG
jgi:hypothetical protein